MEMKSVYLKKFSSVYRSDKELAESVKKWSSALNKFDDETIDMALKLMPSKFYWVPTINEFGSLCNYLSKRKESKEIKEYNDKTINQDKEICRLVNQGGSVCARIKKIFPDLSWIKVSLIFSYLKEFEKKLDKSANDISIISKLSEKDDNYLEDLIKNALFQSGKS